MAQKIICFSNDPINNEPAIENVMIRATDEMNAKIWVEDMKKPPENSGNTSLIVLCLDVNVEEAAALNSIASRYRSHQPVILYKPTNREINTMYRYIEGKDYFSAESTTSSYTLFGLKIGANGTHYILENHEEEPEHVTDSILNFLDDDQGKIDENRRTSLIQTGQKILNENGEETVNLAEMAKNYIVTQQFGLAGKQFSLSYYMISCHIFEGTSLNGGEDWFFIQQYGILNGSGGYQKYWAGTRVNGESWYVGEGEVALNYIDYYRMSNDILHSDSSFSTDVKLLYAEPQAINGVTSCTISESQSITGIVEFEGGATGGNTDLKRFYQCRGRV